MSRWISVKDHLPEFEHGYVLVACDGGHVDCSFYSVDMEFLASSRHAGSYSCERLGKESGYFDLSHNYGYKITHWMPLPEPPKEES